MAVGPEIRIGCKTDGRIVHAASVRGRWLTVNTNLEATADTATLLLTPWNISRATMQWVKVPDGATRLFMRAKNDVAATTFTTQPIIRVVGAYGTPSEAGAFSGTTTDANFASFIRLDNADANAAGLTLTLAATSANLNDASYGYSDLPDLTGYDCKGADYVGFLVETAAAVTGGASHGVYLECMFLN